ncbi:MAG: response regulator transcription factor [Nocardioidaceae bacterium]
MKHDRTSDGGVEMPDPMRVLVVDDSDVVRDLITLNLELEGLSVTCAEDGQEALDLVKALSPHVITLDVMMPRLDGFETASALRADPETAHIPIVMVTGRSALADMERGEALGVDAYLAKPFEPAELVSVVRSLARSGRRLPEA